ncbi:ArnT family glycosyltransferase [Robiginitalea aurantiaca]|uniref:Glycosyltransferase family 39 protein n=1 Tax=Robiginitalea aurantiaca TaxID=3056915 RepID=A0ABT7WDZ0_9FLAO|nr:glycosyltransferase family 39 protein [Robiginitalea aurantiaca]MDM9631140.1 glycosyltransferase family 39 protein [Robiginitalea aurantiaca]
MTKSYISPVYMMSSGYGYSRPVGEYSADTLNSFSVSLLDFGKTLNENNRPDLSGLDLQAMDFRLPGYPMLIFAVYKLTGEPIVRNMSIFQALISSFFPLLFYLIAILLTGQNVSLSLIATWIYALYPPLIYPSTNVLPGCIATGFLLLAIYFLLRAIKNGSIYSILLCGIFIGVSTYFRSTALHIWVFIGFGLFWMTKRFLSSLKFAFIIGISSYLLLTPWAKFNYDNWGRWTYGSSASWCTIWECIGEFDNPWGVIRDDNYANKVAMANGFKDRATFKANDWFKNQVKSYVKENPIFFIKATMKRLPLVIAAPYETGYKNPYREKGIYSYFGNKEKLTPFQILLKHPDYVIKAYWERLLVMLISFFGFISTLIITIRFRKKYPLFLLVSSIMLYYVLLHTLTNPNPRYFTILIPFQILGILVFLFEIFESDRFHLFRPK